MENFSNYAPNVAMLLWLVLLVFLFYRVIRWINVIIKNNALYKDDMLNVLEEIRDELKELNKNNLVK